MDFYAEDLDESPNVAYIAIVGPFEEDFDDELFHRVQRIEEASPGKEKLVLDVRGLTGLEADHYEVLRSLEEQLEEIDWRLYFCNIPSRFKDFFTSGRVQRNFNVFESKRELVEHLSDDGNDETEGDAEAEEEEEVEPVPVVLRTSSGIRLFEGLATDLDQTKLTVYTDDRNAETVKGNDDLDANLYFDTDRIQVVPSEITIETVDEIDHEEWNYRLDILLDEMDELELDQIKEYYRVNTPST